MKLAEALIERADIQTKLNMLKDRLVNNARVHEGTEPNENPSDLIKELNEKLNRLEYLVVHINKTNELTKLSSGETISELIAKKDMLTKKLSLLGSLFDTGTVLINRLTHTEIRIKTAFNVADLQKQIDEVSKQIRLTDAKLQETNWLTELM